MPVGNNDEPIEIHCARRNLVGINGESGGTSSRDIARLIIDTAAAWKNTTTWLQVLQTMVQ